jgi:hypothetical protein
MLLRLRVWRLLLLTRGERRRRHGRHPPAPLMLLLLLFQGWLLLLPRLLLLLLMLLRQPPLLLLHWLLPMLLLLLLLLVPVLVLLRWRPLLLCRLFLWRGRGRRARQARLQRGRRSHRQRQSHGVRDVRPCPSGPLPARRGGKRLVSTVHHPAVSGPRPGLSRRCQVKPGCPHPGVGCRCGVTLSFRHPRGPTRRGSPAGRIGGSPVRLHCREPSQQRRVLPWLRLGRLREGGGSLPPRPRPGGEASRPTQPRHVPQRCHEGDSLPRGLGGVGGQRRLTHAPHLRVQRHRGPRSQQPQGLGLAAGGRASGPPLCAAALPCLRRGGACLPSLPILSRPQAAVSGDAQHRCRLPGRCLQGSGSSREAGGHILRHRARNSQGQPPPGSLRLPSRCHHGRREKGPKTAGGARTQQGLRPGRGAAGTRAGIPGTVAALGAPPVRRRGSGSTQRGSPSRRHGRLHCLQASMHRCCDWPQPSGTAHVTQVPPTRPAASTPARPHRQRQVGGLQQPPPTTACCGSWHADLAVVEQRLCEDRVVALLLHWLHPMRRHLHQRLGVSLQPLRQQLQEGAAERRRGRSERERPSGQARPRISCSKSRAHHLLPGVPPVGIQAHKVLGLQRGGGVGQDGVACPPKALRQGADAGPGHKAAVLHLLPRQGAARHKGSQRTLSCHQGGTRGGQEGELVHELGGKALLGHVHPPLKAEPHPPPS